MTPSCLIVGAAMSGLTAAAALQERGWDVVLFDRHALICPQALLVPHKEVPI